MIEQLHGFRRQRQEAKFVAFAAHADLGFGKQHVVRDSEPALRRTAVLAGASGPRWPGRAQVRKLDQKRATSSTESGTMLRLGAFTRNRLIATRGRPRPIGLRCKKA